VLREEPTASACRPERQSVSRGICRLPEECAALRTEPPGTARVLSADDRLALLRFLAEHGVNNPAAARIIAAGESGVRWHPESSAAEASRFGGDALLPGGTQWPSVTSERPLTFLAALSLDERPSWSPLPLAGWLLFFTELRGPNSAGLIEPAPNQPGSQIRVLFVEGACRADQRRAAARRRGPAVRDLFVP
jgi:hypothetical protein